MKNLSITLVLLLLVIPVDRCNSQNANSTNTHSTNTHSTNTNTNANANANASSTSSDLELAKRIGDLQLIKTRVGQYKELLKDKFKNNEQDPQFVATRKLYIEANSEYDRYVKILEEAIRQGKAKKLDQDADFKGSGEKVANRATAFVQKVNELTASNLGVIPGIGDIVDIGIKIWKTVQDRKDKDRKELADRVKNDLKWDPWNTTSTPGPSPSASPTPSPSPSAGEH